MFGIGSSSVDILDRSLTAIEGTYLMAKTIAEIRRRVRAEASRASGVPVSELEDEHTLKEDLGISHTGFVSMAQSLDTFVKSENPGGSVLVGDLENDSSTVGSTDSLVEERMRR